MELMFDLLKILLPISVPSGKTTSTPFIYASKKAAVSILVKPAGRDDENARQDLKALLPIVVTVDGMLKGRSL